MKRQPSINDAVIVGYVDHTGELQHYKFSFDQLPYGSGMRAAKVAELNRAIEAYKGQGVECGYWTLEDWARGWGRKSLTS